MEHTRLHPSTSSSTLRQCEIETNRSRKLHRENEPTTFPMLNGDVASPTSTITKRWTSGKTPRIDILCLFSQISLISVEFGEKMSSFSFCRLSHDGAISPLESNGLLKSKETVISLDYVWLTLLFTSPRNKPCSQGTYTPVSPYKEANGQTKGSGAGEVIDWIQTM